MKKPSVLKGTKKPTRPKPLPAYKTFGTEIKPRTFYDPDFHPQDFITHCREGTTRTEICAAWGVSANTILNWSKKYPEFSRAYKMGGIYHVAKWTKRIEDMALGKPCAKNYRFGPMIWYMKNTCGWSDDGGISDFQGTNAHDYTFHDQETNKVYNADGTEADPEAE